VATGIGCK